MDPTQLVPCRDCGCWVPGGAPGCGNCAAWIEADVTAAWRAELSEHAVADGEERAFAEAVLAEPRGVIWRVVDAALIALSCESCGLPLGSGPVRCVSCEEAHGRRWVAAEPDRPGVPFGNEHAIRVSTAVARVPHRFPAHMVPRYAGALPLLIAGQMPAKGQPAAIQRYLNNGGDGAALRRVRTFDEAYAIATGGRTS